MTFLQPLILFGLPLVLLPVLIHLLNRLRYRTQQWAAMRFLLSAQKQSIRRSRLRQWLVLLMRMLAILAIILFLARPMTGGWSSAFSSGQPEFIVLILDRSASMETRLPNGQTRRERALQSFVETVAVREGAELVLFENIRPDEPQLLKQASELLEPEMERFVGSTETTADVPDMIGKAFDWLEDNEIGSAEIWIASDLEENDWDPDGSNRWEALSARYQEKKDRFGLRLLNYDAKQGNNARLLSERVVRRKDHLDCTLKLDRDENSDAPLVIELIVNGERREIPCDFEGTSFRWQPKVEIDPASGEGWGKFKLPTDGNDADNEAYFVFGSPSRTKAFVIAQNKVTRQALSTASTNFSDNENGRPKTSSSTDLEQGSLDTTSLLLWQGPLPNPASAQTVKAFAEKGGVVIFLPPQTNDEGVFANCSWTEVSNAPSPDQPFKIKENESREWPLSDTEEGFRLPLGEISFLKRRGLKGDTRRLASFEDGTPFLSRASLGKGNLYFLHTLPEEEWSDLADGFTLVPMIQRLLKAGASQLDPPVFHTLGTPGLVGECVDAPNQKDINTHAGIYRINGQLAAVNRPPAENASNTLQAEQCKDLLGEESILTVEDTGSGSLEVPAEVWRWFLFLTLAALMVEALLVLPSRKKPEAASGLAKHQEGTA